MSISSERILIALCEVPPSYCLSPCKMSPAHCPLQQPIPFPVHSLAALECPGEWGNVYFVTAPSEVLRAVPGTQLVLAE